MSSNDFYIKEIDRLRAENAELKKIKELAKLLVDASNDLKKTPKELTEERQKKFAILYRYENQLNEIFYPKQKPKQVQQQIAWNEHLAR